MKDLAKVTVCSPVGVWHTSRKEVLDNGVEVYHCGYCELAIVAIKEDSEWIVEEICNNCSGVVYSEAGEYRIDYFDSVSKLSSLFEDESVFRTLKESKAEVVSSGSMRIPLFGLPYYSMDDSPGEWKGLDRTVAPVVTKSATSPEIAKVEEKITKAMGEFKKEVYEWERSAFESVRKHTAKKKVRAMRVPWYRRKI